MTASTTGTKRQRVFAALEVPSIVAVPAVLVACAVNGVQAAAGLTLLLVVLCVGLFLASYEASRPALRQVMPTATLAGLAAAGRILFAPIPDVKPVSAITIVAGATLGRREGFMVGALAALVSNFFFGQGVWTPWQMYDDIILQVAQFHIDQQFFKCTLLQQQNSLFIITNTINLTLPTSIL